jgi:hypothetical protein
MEEERTKRTTHHLPVPSSSSSGQAEAKPTARCGSILHAYFAVLRVSRASAVSLHGPPSTTWITRYSPHAPPKPFPLRDTLPSTPTPLGAEPLQRRSPAPVKSPVTTGAITGARKKFCRDDPRESELPRAGMVSGSGGAPDSVGFARSASACPPPWPGTAAAPSSDARLGPPPGIPHCNNAAKLAGGDSASHIPSADTAASVAGKRAAPVVGTQLPLAFGKDWWDFQKGPWEVTLPEAHASEGNLTPLRGTLCR